MVFFDQQIIEGVGNEVFWATTLGSVALILFAFIIVIKLGWPVNSRTQGLHELSQAAVDNIRHLVRYSNRLETEAQENDAAASNHATQDGNVMDTQHFGPDNHCPICLNNPQYPVETNCGHLFCAQCVILYWRHGNWRGAIRCPVCRQQVSVLLRCFRDNLLPEQSREERNQILWDINDYNRRFSGEPRPWLDYLWDLPTLLRHLGSEFFSVGGLMYMFRLRIVLCFVAAIMYLISPLDMIPEAVFGILGLLDDLFVVLLLAIYVTVVYRRFLAGRWQEES